LTLFPCGSVTLGTERVAPASRIVEEGLILVATEALVRETAEAGVASHVTLALSVSRGQDKVTTQAVIRERPVASLALLVARTLSIDDNLAGETTRTVLGGQPIASGTGGVASASPVLED
jgi:hypothetical protein